VLAAKVYDRPLIAHCRQSSLINRMMILRSI
jgi:hypothetical protein